MLKKDNINEDGLFNYVEFVLKNQFQDDLMGLYLRARESSIDPNLVIKAYYYKKNGDTRMCTKILRRLGIDISESGGDVFSEYER